MDAKMRYKFRGRVWDRIERKFGVGVGVDGAHTHNNNHIHDIFA